MHRYPRVIERPRSGTRLSGRRRREIAGGGARTAAGTALRARALEEPGPRLGRQAPLPLFGARAVRGDRNPRGAKQHLEGIVEGETQESAALPAGPRQLHIPALSAQRIGKLHARQDRARRSLLLTAFDPNLILQRALVVPRDSLRPGVEPGGQLPDREDRAGITDVEVEAVLPVTAAAERRERRPPDPGPCGSEPAERAPERPKPRLG